MDYGGAHNSHLKAKSAAYKQNCVNFKIQHGRAETQDCPDTLSPSSSNSSSDDYFQVKPKILPKLRVQINNKPLPSTDPLNLPFHKNDTIDLSIEALSIDVGSPGSTPRFSNITYESPMPQFSLTQSPPMQLMDKFGGFDPTRIPQAAFSKSSTPAEWSTTSNESLFSIRIEDGSVSRNRVSSEVLKSKELSVNGELIRIRPPSSPNIIGIEPYFDIEEVISAEPEEILILDERIGDGPNMGPVNNNHVHAVKREIRLQNFVKPKKKKSSHCGGCCLVSLCGCIWPSCSFNWCVWPSCSGTCSSLRCKCPELLSCCCKCPELSSCCCKFPNWSSCCCKFPNCCKCSSWSCCKCSSWSCFKCSSCCKCRCLNCLWACCCCWEHKREMDFYGFPTKLTDGGTTNSESSTKALSQRKNSCFSCLSSCR